jgi:hypothetical protein
MHVELTRNGNDVMRCDMQQEQALKLQSPFNAKTTDIRCPLRG